MEKLVKHKNGQWVLTKVVRKPSYGSIEVHEGIQREDAPLREKKYQGGDPKHQDRAGVKTKAGNEKEYSMPDTKGKPKGITGGASGLNREKLIQKPYEEIERKAFKERQVKKSEEVVKFDKNGQWSLYKTEDPKKPSVKYSHTETGPTGLKEHVYELHHDNKKIGTIAHDPKYSENNSAGVSEKNHKYITDDVEKQIINHAKKLNKSDDQYSLEKDNTLRGSEKKIGSIISNVPSRYSSGVEDKEHSLHVDTGNGDYILRHKASGKVIHSGSEPSSSSHPKVKQWAKEEKL